MNVYQRPLFRQMGGPVAPGMAAQEARAPMAGGQDPSAMLQQVEGMAAQQTQGLGAQYAQEMLAGIDRAETPEQIINALRGNEAPLQQRYAELAQFVGDADAQRTPESVLALVQPTIMMTEQGVLDSGIGELMQSLVGQVEMETEGGAPTPMGQGVGSLMMAGAPAAPEMGVGQQPVANFSQGGVVQRFQTGGEASRLQALYSEMLPVYQSILGDGGEQQRLTQAQILFDIADRAGAFAAGIDPRTGQSMARLSPAAQLAGALSGLGGQIGERLGSQEEQDRALRLAALQAAQGEYSAERAAARAAGANRGVGTLYDVLDREGNLVRRVPISTRAELDQLTAEVAEIGGDFRPSQFDATGLTDEDYFTKFGMTRAAFEALPVADQRRLQGLAPEIGADVKGIPRDVFDRLSLEDQQRVILGDASPGAVNGIPRDIFDNLSQADQQKILGTAPEAAPDVKGIPAAVFNTLSLEDQRRVILGDTSPGAVNGIPRDIFDNLSQADQQRILGTAPEAAPDVKGIPAAVFNTLSLEDQRRVILGDTSPGAVNGIPRDIFDNLSQADQQRILGTAPEAAPDVKGIPRDIFNTLPTEDQRRVLVGDTSPGAVNGVPRDIFDRLSAEDQQRVLGTAPAAPADIKGIPAAVFNTLSLEDQRRVLVGDTSPGAIKGVPRDIFDRLSAEDQQRVLGTAPEPAGDPATLIERQQAALTDQRTLDNLENLSPQALGLFAANAAAYIQETVGPAGVSSRLPLPPNTQEAMRRAYAAGVDFPGIDPTFFGAPLRPEDMQSMGLALLDINNVDLGAATGFVSTLARSINFLSEQVAEVAGREGTVFTQTAEASGALNALAQATRRFYLEGRTLAREFENLEREIPTFSGFLTDAAARRALERQRALLEGEVARVMDVIENPRRYTNADISQARRMQVYASQLLATYDQFLQAYQGVNRRGTTPTYDDIMANPDYILND